MDSRGIDEVQRPLSVYSGVRRETLRSGPPQPRVVRHVRPIESIERVAGGVIDHLDVDRVRCCLGPGERDTPRAALGAGCVLDCDPAGLQDRGSVLDDPRLEVELATGCADRAEQRHAVRVTRVQRERRRRSLDRIGHVPCARVRVCQIRVCPRELEGLAPRHGCKLARGLGLAVQADSLLVCGDGVVPLDQQCVHVAQGRVRAWILGIQLLCAATDLAHIRGLGLDRAGVALLDQAQERHTHVCGDCDGRWMLTQRSAVHTHCICPAVSNLVYHGEVREAFDHLGCLLDDELESFLGTREVAPASSLGCGNVLRLEGACAVCGRTQKEACKRHGRAAHRHRLRVELMFC
eukprot:m.147509 g.147509  ORF g.147509 m.147509 type:complete len:350 (+) comp9708_c1_seq6:1326-2375(+)